MNPKKNRAAVALGRLGGAKKTAAKSAASRRNGQLAGRPGRVCVDCGEPVRGGHKDARLDARCTGQAWKWDAARQRGPAPPSAADVALDQIAAIVFGPVPGDASTIQRILRRTGRRK